MKYFSLSEIFSSIVGAVSFGAVFGVLLSALAIVFDNLTVILKTPYRAFIIADKPRLWRMARHITDNGAPRSKILVSVRDFLFTVSFGISYIFLIYLVSDGIPRLYILFFSAGASFAVYKLFGLHLRRLFRALFLWLFSFLTLILALMLALPKRAIMRFLVPLGNKAKSFFAAISGRLCVIFQKRIVKKGKK